jgi:hypothetical protein
MYDKVDAIRVLCELKAKLEAKDKVRAGRPGTVLSEPQTNSLWNSQENRTALYKAVQMGAVNAVRVLVELGADVNVKDTVRDPGIFFGC